MAGLPALLARTLLDFNCDFESAGGEQEERPSLLVWADLLRAIPDGGISVRDLAGAARISRRALTSMLTLERTGWFTVEATELRVKIVSLSEAGRRARDGGSELVDETERAWRTKVGDAEVKRLRSALEALVSRLDLELPHYPITYGPADPSAIGGGGAVRAKAGPPRIPPHGTDWAPVVRQSGDTVSGLPVPALLSQALMAFTIDYEERVFPMAIAALLARTMPEGSAPMAVLPEVLGVNGLGKSLLERHGIVAVSGRDDERVANLTPLGIRIRDAHEPMLARVDQQWRERYGNELVGELAVALEAVQPRLRPGLPDHVVVRHVVGTGFVDISRTVR